MHARSTAVLLVIAATSLAAATLAACGDDDHAAPTSGCPVAPIEVVVTVDQWGDIVRTLGGACAEVTTIIRGDAGDPHEYEPTPSDAASIESAKLVVVNGLGYDEWAAKSVAAASDRPAVVDAAKVADAADGANPHLWYSPDVVGQVASAVTDELKRLAPGAADVFDRGAAAWAKRRTPWDDAIAALRPAATGASFAATESVAGYLTEALGMVDATPEGYAAAAANETEPSPGDLAAFEDRLADGSIRVLLLNAQTEGPAPRELRKFAEQHDVPVVEVTETIPASAHGFVDWQVRQLDRLRTALAS